MLLSFPFQSSGVCLVQRPSPPPRTGRSAPGCEQPQEGVPQCAVPGKGPGQSPLRPPVLCTATWWWELVPAGVLIWDQPSLLPTSLSLLPFVLSFNKCFLSSYCVSSAVPPWEQNSESEVGPARRELPDHPLFFLPGEPRALNPLLEAPGKESVYTTGCHRAVWAKADLQGRICPQPTGKDTSLLVCPQPHIRQSPLRVADSTVFPFRKLLCVARQHLEVLIMALALPACVLRF